MIGWLKIALSKIANKNLKLQKESFYQWGYTSITKYYRISVYNENYCPKYHRLILYNDKTTALNLYLPNLTLSFWHFNTIFMLQGWRRHFAVYYTSPQSFLIRCLIIFNFHWILIGWFIVGYPNVSTTNYYSIEGTILDKH